MCKCVCFLSDAFCVGLKVLLLHFVAEPHPPPWGRGWGGGGASHYTLHITTKTGSSVALCMKWPPSPNKDASPPRAPHSTMNLVTPPPPPNPPNPPPLPLQSVLPAPTVSLWKWSVPERWVEPLHVYIGPRGIPACPLLLLSFVSQMDTN